MVIKQPLLKHIDQENSAPNMKQERRMGESMLQYIERQTKTQIEQVLGKKVADVPQHFVQQENKGRVSRCYVVA